MREQIIKTPTIALVTMIFQRFSDQNELIHSNEFFYWALPTQDQICIHFGKCEFTKAASAKKPKMQMSCKIQSLKLFKGIDLW